MLPTHADTFCQSARRKSSATVLIVIAGLLLGATAASAQEDESARDMKAAAALLDKLTGFYNGASDAQGVAQSLLSALGWIKSDPSLNDKLTKVQKDLNTNFAAVVSRQTLEYLATVRGNTKTGLDRLVMDYPKIAITSQSDANNFTLLAKNLMVKNPDARNLVFYRQYTSHDDDVLKLLNRNYGSPLFTKKDMDPQADNPNLVYDWRLALPTLMTVVSYRLQVLAAMNPNFMTDAYSVGELTDMRDELLVHYNLMLKGIKCGPYAWTCVDLHSGKYQFADYGGAPLPTSGVLGVYSVRGAMPIFELKAMIDMLYIYSHPSADLTRSYHRISSAQNSSYCLEVTNQLSGKPGWWAIANYCNGGSAQQWVYDRSKGTVTNTGTLGTPATGQCLGIPGGASPFAISISDCRGDRGQLWTFDPQTQALMSAYGTFLRIRWDNLAVIPYSAPAYSVVSDQPGAALGWKWQADQPAAGAPAFSDLMRSGESMYPGQSRVSNSNRYTFTLQLDGNLVLYETSTAFGAERSIPLWASNTNGRTVRRVVMQNDGNLVLYAPGKSCSTKSPSPLPPTPCVPSIVQDVPIWASNTNGYSGSYLSIQNDGNVVIYQPTTTAPVARWATNTNR